LLIIFDRVAYCSKTGERNQTKKKKESTKLSLWCSDFLFFCRDVVVVFILAPCKMNTTHTHSHIKYTQDNKREKKIGVSNNSKQEISDKNIISSSFFFFHFRVLHRFARYE
jgi:hypothetical protein